MDITVPTQKGGCGIKRIYKFMLSLQKYLAHNKHSKILAKLIIFYRKNANKDNKVQFYTHSLTFLLVQIRTTLGHNLALSCKLENSHVLQSNYFTPT